MARVLPGGAVARLLLGALLLAALAAAPALAGEGAASAPLLRDRLEAPGGPVTRVVLAGGPTVLLQPRPGSPAVAVALAVPAGSRFDPPGRAGLAHLLEHLVFRSSPHFSAGRLPLELEAVGARSGARTTPEHALFWEVVPADRLELALSLEADRLGGLTFSTRDLEREVDGVAAEVEALRRRPDFAVEAWLRRRLRPAEPPSALVPAGDPAQIRAVTADDLRDLYGRAYRPDQAVLALVGDFDVEAVLARLQQLFPADPDVLPTPAPKSAGEAGPAPPADDAPPPEAGLVMLAFPGPACDGEDYAALLALDAMLTDGRAALLRRAVGDRGRLDVDPDPSDGFHRFMVILEPGAAPAQVEGAVRSVLESVRTRPVAKEELESAARRARARFLRAWDDPAARARALAEAEAGASLAALLDVPRRLGTLQPEGLRASAARLLDPARLRAYAPAAAGAPPAPPGGGGAGTAEATPDDGGPAAPVALPAPPGLPPLQRTELDNGATVMVWRDPQSPTVTVRGYLPGGALLDSPERAGMTALAARAMGKGALAPGGPTLQEALEERGMRLVFRGDRQAVTLEGWCLREDLPRFGELLSAALRRVRPGPQDMAAARAEALRAVRQEASSVAGRALRAFVTRLYPEGHPLARPLDGTEETLALPSDDEVRARIERMARPDRLVLGFVGDVGESEVVQALRPALTSWFVEGAPLRPELPEAPPPTASREDLAGSGDLALVLAGHLGPSRRDADWYAFVVLNQILGGNPASSRLARRIRDMEGLGPSVSSRLVPLVGPTPWAVTLRVRPDQVEAALKAVREEMERLAREAPSEDEVKRAVSALEGRLQVSLAEPGARGDMLAALEFFRLSDSYPRGFSGLYSKITPADVQAVAKSRLRPDSLVVVVASPEGPTEPAPPAP